MICNRVFLKPNQLKHHFKRHERERSDCNSFECHLCRYKFLAVHGLRLHMNLKHITGMKNAFQCTHCNDAFVNQLELDNHLRTVCSYEIKVLFPFTVSESLETIKIICIPFHKNNIFHTSIDTSIEGII